MLDALDRNTRLTLMRFVCSFAWADLEIRPGEREFVDRMMRRLDLDPAERAEVEGWLKVPPEPEDIDPTHVPLDSRRTFVETLEGLIRADGEVADEELENLELFKVLLS